MSDKKGADISDIISTVDNYLTGEFNIIVDEGEVKPNSEAYKIIEADYQERKLQISIFLAAAAGYSQDEMKEIFDMDSETLANHYIEAHEMIKNSSQIALHTANSARSLGMKSEDILSF